MSIALEQDRYMRIRKEDKKIVQYLALVGAISGAFIALLGIITESGRAHEQYQLEQQYVQEHFPLMYLRDSTVQTKDQVVSTEVLDNSKTELAMRQAKVAELEQGFWIKLPLWGLIGLCILAGLGGIIGGFSVTWMICWTGSIGMYTFIRGVYSLIRLVAPNSSIVSVPDNCQEGSGMRDEGRILPIFIKWSIIMLLAALLIGLILSRNWNFF
jgi:hypothetical protein